MKNFYNLLSEVLLIALLSGLFANQVNAQVSNNTKSKVEIIKEESNPESKMDEINVLLESLTNNYDMSIGESDSTFKEICIYIDAKSGGQGRLIKIVNGDTIINEGFNDSLVQVLKNAMNPDSISHRVRIMNKKIEYVIDSSNAMNIDEIFALSNWNDLVPYDADYEIDNLIDKTITKKDRSDSSNQIIFVGQNGENIKIEIDSEMVFINRSDDIKDIDSNVEIIQNEAGEKVVVLKTSIVLDEWTKEEMDGLKSKGIKFSKKEPDFDFIRFYPNPSTQSINIHFKLKDVKHVDVRITNMLGQVVFNDERSNFSGEYKQAVDLKQHGEGTYLLQIAQGNRMITRKIIVE